MRNFLMISTAALALTACGPKAANPTPNVNAMAAGTSTDTVVPPSETATTTGTDANTSTAAIAATTLTPEEFVTKASMSDLYETTAGKIAVKKATDPKVKAFAEQMVEAHTGTTRNLRTAMASDNVSVTPPAALDARHQALIAALDASPQGNFDELYKGQQRDAHAEALGVMQSYAMSGDKAAIKKFAATTAPKVESHIAMLKQLG